MLINLKPQLLYYALLKHSDVVKNGHRPIDDAIDRLCAIRDSLGQISPAVQLSSLEKTVRYLRCQSSYEVQTRLLEAKWRTACNFGQSGQFHEHAYNPYQARALEAAAVYYAMQRFIKRYASFLACNPSQAQSVRYLLQSQGEKVLASVARDIDLFGEMHETRTLEMQGALLALMHLRQSNSAVYRLVSNHQNHAVSPRKGSTRFRTVSMTLEFQEEEAISMSPKCMLQGRRAFSMEAHAGIPAGHS